MSGEPGEGITPPVEQTSAGDIESPDAATPPRRDMPPVPSMYDHFIATRRDVVLPKEESAAGSNPSNQGVEAESPTLKFDMDSPDAARIAQEQHAAMFPTASRSATEDVKPDLASHLKDSGETSKLYSILDFSRLPMISGKDLSEISLTPEQMQESIRFLVEKGIVPEKEETVGLAPEDIERVRSVSPIDAGTLLKGSLVSAWLEAEGYPPLRGALRLQRITTNNKTGEVTYEPLKSESQSTEKPKDS